MNEHRPYAHRASLLFMIVGRVKACRIRTSVGHTRTARRNRVCCAAQSKTVNTSNYILMPSDDVSVFYDSTYAPHNLPPLNATGPALTTGPKCSHSQVRGQERDQVRGAGGDLPDVSGRGPVDQD
jgi:hypothetical protein